MSLVAACGLTLLRSVVIALLALPICSRLCDLIRMTGRWRALIWCLLLAPFVCPELLIAYVYSVFSLQAFSWVSAWAPVNYDAWNQAVYTVLVFMKVVPIGTVAVCFSPPSPLTLEALHCRRMLIPPDRKWWNRIANLAGFWIRGPIRNLLPVAGIAFLLAFQEFEIASLMQVDSWTVWLFDKQVGGLALKETLKYALLPLACELLVLLPLIYILLRDSVGLTERERMAHPLSRATRFGMWTYLIVSIVVVCGVPLAVAPIGTPDGFKVLFSSGDQARGFAREILTSAGYGTISAVAAYLLATMLKVSASRKAALRMLGPIAAIIPGLCGSLILSFMLLAVFRNALPARLYQSGLPLMIALILYFLPRAVLLQLLLRMLRPEQSRHAASLLQSSPIAHQRRQGHELIWKLKYRPHFWAIVLICYWGYLELTATALLAPTGIVTISVRLYNLMHYSRNSVLSAMTILTMALPVIGLAACFMVRRLLVFALRYWRPSSVA